MTINLKTSFVGAGNMAGALIQGLLRGGTAPDRIWASDPRGGRLAELTNEHGIRTGSDNGEAARWADVVVLAVKPQVFGELFSDLGPVIGPDQLVLSVAAGVTIRAIEGGLGTTTRVVRAMPNTPSLVGSGITAYACGTAATDADAALADELFRGVGASLRVDEQHLDAVTGLSGSGPAYVFRLIEGLVQGGLDVGLDRDTALTLAAHTVRGAAELLIGSGEAPASLREKVTSPNGTTLAGLTHLSEHGFLDVVSGAVRAATARSKELGTETEAALVGD